MSLEDPLTELAHRVDHRYGWHRLPTPLGVLSLRQMRQRLRASNLHHTGSPPDLLAGEAPAGAAVGRSIAGLWTDADDPLMGAAGCRFGRNVPLEHSWPEVEPRLLTPSPRTVSLDLMTRDAFRPATILNVLAAAWIQFEVHDWFSHGPNEANDAV